MSKRGSSSPDIFTTKGLTRPSESTREDLAGNGSDHLSVELILEFAQATIHNPKQQYIPRRQRRNPRLLENDGARYQLKLPTCLEGAKSPEGKEELKAAYKRFKETLFHPWEKYRKHKRKRFRTFWNDTLDTMAKHKRRLYRK